MADYIPPCPFGANTVHEVQRKDGKTRCTRHTLWIKNDDWDAASAASFEPEPEPDDVERCPGCGHQPHPPGGCLNMASDNDCDCKVGEKLEACPDCETSGRYGCLNPWHKERGRD